MGIRRRGCCREQSSGSSKKLKNHHGTQQFCSWVCTPRTDNRHSHLHTNARSSFQINRRGPPRGLSQLGGQFWTSAQALIPGSQIRALHCSLLQKMKSNDGQTRVFVSRCTHKTWFVHAAEYEVLPWRQHGWPLRTLC